MNQSHGYPWLFFIVGLGARSHPDPYRVAGVIMIKAGKKFNGAKRYYHSHLASAEEVRANPDWPERLQLLKRERRARIWKVIFYCLLCIGLVGGTFYLAMIG